MTRIVLLSLIVLFFKPGLEMKEYVATMAGVVHFRPQFHEGRCVVNENCGYFTAGFDCSSDCLVLECGNTLYRDGTLPTEVEVWEK